MQKMIFFNTGWMHFYKGKYRDKIQGGGKFVDEEGYGHEIFNFLPFNGYLYGFVQPKLPQMTINISRLGVSEYEESINNVIVVWVAKHPSGGRRVVGWYMNATLYRYWQKPINDKNRKLNKRNEEFGYYVKAKEKDGYLLPIDDRVFSVSSGKGGFGRSNVWFADKTENLVYNKRVLEYLKNGGKLKDRKKRKKVDQILKFKVEKAAIDFVILHYEKNGYTIKSVEKENLGWDLEARLHKQNLKIEVKGLSGSIISVDLTPNEYSKMNENTQEYRLCIVISVLKNPKLHTFFYTTEISPPGWIDDNRKKLEISEKIGARCTYNV